MLHVPGHRRFCAPMLEPQNRREFLLHGGAGFGAIALAGLLQSSDVEADSGRGGNPFAERPPHFSAKAKRVIFLFMDGGPSHLDLLDRKPKLQELAGQKLPASFGRVDTAMGVGTAALLPTQRKWQRYGKCGLEVSDWLPNIATCADDLAVVRSCWANGQNHVGSVCQMNTGSILAGRPSLGAWVTYGLGTSNQNLPAFVILCDSDDPPGGTRNWGPGFLSAAYQGTSLRNGATPILNLNPPAEISATRQQRKLAFLKDLNREHAKARPEDSLLDARIHSFELAYRMQAHAPEVVDFASETKATRELYGLDQKETAAVARNCILARRLVERGVRFVQVYCGSGSKWDSHRRIEINHAARCRESDRPVAGLLKDLKSRGLLDSTLVIWGGEFGRTPMTEGGDGRDHNPFGFTMWFAGGGVKGGHVIGATDELGLRAVQDRVHVHDLHATILHALGMNHRKLTFLFNGRDERATINGGNVVTRLFA